MTLSTRRKRKAKIDGGVLSTKARRWDEALPERYAERCAAIVSRGNSSLSNGTER